MANRGKISESYFGDEMTRYGFVSHMESYIKQLLANPKTAKVDDYLKSHGIDNEKALELLLKRPDKNDYESSVIVKKTKIKTGDDGKDIFSITYKIPDKATHRKKIRNLYINCFESNIVEGCPINEELNYYERPLSSTPSPFKSGEKVISQCKPGSTGDRLAKCVNDNDNAYVPHMFSNEDQMVKDIEAMDKDEAYKKRGGLNKPIVKETDCGGCLQGGGENPDAGEYVAPMGKPIKRTILMNEDQFNYLKRTLEEATASVSDVTPASELAYPAFSGDKNFAGDTLNHDNICADKNLMDGGVAGGKA